MGWKSHIYIHAVYVIKIMPIKLILNLHICDFPLPMRFHKVILFYVKSYPGRRCLCVFGVQREFSAKTSQPPLTFAVFFSIL